MKINAINNIRVSNYNNIKQPTKVNNASFKDFLMSSIDEISGLEKESMDLDAMIASGLSDNFAEAKIAASKAEMALSFSVEVKNKVMDAYKEIMRMQL